MIKFIFRVFASLAVALALEPGAATAATPDSPETTVKTFYTWYLQQAGSVYQLTDSHIYNHVAKPTVDNLRDDYRHKRLPGGADYFTRVQDIDPQIWLKTMTLHPAIALGGTVVIPVDLRVRGKTESGRIRREGKRTLADNQGRGHNRLPRIPPV
ncbi:hypothetical protein OKW50_005863 [Paraburkholderia youngii]|uniref:DUF3828 domain-containing protein n=1 Tax=Paraburkholderia youngii TaxID=2782701 RepID=UPI003D1B0400